MKIFTSHLKPGTPPVMVQEGFSFGAALFGCLWLLWRRAWIPAALELAAGLLITRLATAIDIGPLPLGLIVLQGMFGRDLVRWGLERRGYAPGPVVAGANCDDALVRLVTERADLFPDIAGSLG